MEPSQRTPERARSPNSWDRQGKASVVLAEATTASPALSRRHSTVACTSPRTADPLLSWPAAASPDGSSPRADVFTRKSAVSLPSAPLLACCLRQSSTSEPSTASAAGGSCAGASPAGCRQAFPAGVSALARRHSLGSPASPVAARHAQTQQLCAPLSASPGSDSDTAAGPRSVSVRGWPRAAGVWRLGAASMAGAAPQPPHLQSETHAALQQLSRQPPRRRTSESSLEGLRAAAAAAATAAGQQGAGRGGGPDRWPSEQLSVTQGCWGPGHGDRSVSGTGCGKSGALPQLRSGSPLPALRARGAAEARD